MSLNNNLFTFFSRACGTLVVLICVFVLLGWAFDVSILKIFLPGYITMKANTAAGLMILGCCPWLLMWKNAVDLVSRKSIESENDATKSAPKNPFVHQPRAGHRGRLLIAEDDAINQKIISTMVEKMGYSCDVVDNGLKALEALEKNKYDGILLDCFMPEMDGLQVAHAIRKKEHENKSLPMPIIAVTANSFKEDRDKCFEYGMNDFISKPFMFENLALKIDKWFFNALETEPVLNEEILLRLKNLNTENAKDLLPHLISYYFDQGSQKIENINVAVLNQDIKTTKSLAHALKSSSAALGAMQVAETCKKIEFSDFSNELEVKALIKDLKDNYQQAKLALQFYLKKEGIQEEAA